MQKCVRHSAVNRSEMQQKKSMRDFVSVSAGQSLKTTQTMVDYRKLRWSNLGSDEFKHLKLILFWPIFGFFFVFVERFYPVKQYYSMHCALDDLIPFCEWFLIPYLFWFVYLIGTLLYTLFYDTPSFSRLMKYIIITNTAAIVIYLLFPSCQELRPTEFPRDNLLTDITRWFYAFDTNTNVCPSIHVMSSLAVMETAIHSDTIRSKGWKTAYVVIAVLICLSTVFLKQHSVLDVFAALPLCLIAHWFSFRCSTGQSAVESEDDTLLKNKNL